MTKPVLIEFEPEDVKLIVNILMNAPLQGNIQSLPKALQRVADLVNKMQDSIREEQVENAPLRDTNGKRSRRRSKRTDHPAVSS